MKHTDEMERQFNRKLDKVFAWGVVIIVAVLVVKWLLNFM